VKRMVLTSPGFTLHPQHCCQMSSNLAISRCSHCGRTRPPRKLFQWLVRRIVRRLSITQHGCHIAADESIAFPRRVHVLSLDVQSSLSFANDGGAFSSFRVGAGSARVGPHTARVDGMTGKIVDFLLCVGGTVAAVWFLIHLRHG
jgi:hypothetical protein